eukprot:COSAG05_NODE_405_length_10177_cov_2.310776_4_plen_87_part_00
MEHGSDTAANAGASEDDGEQQLGFAARRAEREREIAVQKEQMLEACIDAGVANGVILGQPGKKPATVGVNSYCPASLFLVPVPLAC